MRITRQYKLMSGRILLAALLLMVAAAVSARPLTLGSLSEAPSGEIALFLPLAKYLVAGLKEQGIDEARVQVARTHAEMAELMKQGEVDLFIDSSISALLVQRISGGEFLARRWKKGLSEYHSVIFVNKMSPVAALADLNGRTIAFEESFSSSGYLLPASNIRQAGMVLIPSEKQPPATAVAYRFSGADENTLLWVLSGRVDAGAMAANALTKLSAPLGDAFRVIHASQVIPYHVVVARPGLEPALSQAIQTRLLTMEDSPAGLETLKGFEKTTRFDAIPVGVLRNLQSINLDLTPEKR